MKSIKQYGIAVVIAFALVFGVSTLEAAGWSAPPGSPPSGNVDAPVNIGLNTQSKLGQLILNSSVSNPYAVGLQVFGTSVFNGNIQVATGSPTAGKVLTAADSNGTAVWQTPTSGGDRFGGIFMSKQSQDSVTANQTNNTPLQSSDPACRHPNPKSNNCACPPGYMPYEFWDWYQPSGSAYVEQQGVDYMYECL